MIVEGLGVFFAAIVAATWVPTLLIWCTRLLGWVVAGCPAAFVVVGQAPFATRAVGRHVFVQGSGWWRQCRLIEQLPRGNALRVERRLYRMALATFLVAAIATAAIVQEPLVTGFVAAAVLLALVVAALFSESGLPVAPNQRPVPLRCQVEFERYSRDLSGEVHRHWARGAASALAQAGAPLAARSVLGDLSPDLPLDEAAVHHWVTVDIYRALGDTEGMRRAAAEMRALWGEGATATAADVDAIADAIDGRVESLDAHVSALGVRAELGNLALRDLVRSIASQDTRGVAAALWAHGGSWGCDGWEVGARALHQGGDGRGAFRASQQALLVAYGWTLELDGGAREETIPRLSRLLLLMEEVARTAGMPPPAFVAQVREVVAAPPLDAPTANS